MQKKGAIELSMTTIIVVVIGVTLLILGLVFVRGIFSKLGGLTEKEFEIAEQQLNERMSGADRMGVYPDIVEIAPGESTSVAVGIKNFVADESETTSSKFRVDVTPSANSKKEWITLPPELNLRPGDRKVFKIIVQLPNNAVLGRSYTFTVTSYKGNEEWDSLGLIVKAVES